MDCEKKAIHIRSKQQQISWWNLRGYDILFSKRTDFFRNVEASQIEYTRTVDPEYG